MKKPGIFWMEYRPMCTNTIKVNLPLETHYVLDSMKIWKKNKKRWCWVVIDSGTRKMKFRVSRTRKKIIPRNGLKKSWNTRFSLILCQILSSVHSTLKKSYRYPNMELPKPEIWALGIPEFVYNGGCWREIG